MLGFNLADFCEATSGIMQFVGYILTIIKVAIPILIIAFGIIDLGKAVTSGKDEDTKKAAKTLLWRAVAGVAVFFIPSIVVWLFGTISMYNDATQNGASFETCEKCLLQPWSCTVSTPNNY